MRFIVVPPALPTAAKGSWRRGAGQAGLRLSRNLGGQTSLDRLAASRFTARVSPRQAHNGSLPSGFRSAARGAGLQYLAPSPATTSIRPIRERVFFQSAAWRARSFRGRRRHVSFYCSPSGHAARGCRSIGWSVSDRFRSCIPCTGSVQAVQYSGADICPPVASTALVAGSAPVTAFLFGIRSVLAAC